jgi:myo-inositol-1(or 4)-monophosphatase
MQGMVARLEGVGGMLCGDMSPLHIPPEARPPDALPRVHSPLPVDEERWLSCVTAMAAAGKEAVQPLYGRAAGRVVLGRGAGGDRTMEIDRVCEEAIHKVLRVQAPFPHLLISEESGISGRADALWRVVVDPLDGSLNAKRGLEPFGTSIAVANGPTLGDARVGYIEDYLRPHTFCAVKGSGLIAAGAPGEMIDPHRFESDLVEIVLLEAGRPDRHRFEYHDLSAMGGEGLSQDMRIRQIGSLALSLCYVAVGVADILVAAVRSRSVDIAAGLLILSEAGGAAATLGGADVLAQPLDLEKRCAFVAWRAGLDGEKIVARALGLRQAMKLVSE